jgi:hypothetical protein
VRLKRILGRTIVVTAAAAGFAVLIGRARGTGATTSLAWGLCGGGAVLLLLACRETNPSLHPTNRGLSASRKLERAYSRLGWVRSCSVWGS